jgi:DNA-binding MarR family transcriptional regulator
MTVSSKKQETQARVLVALQRRHAIGFTGAPSAAYLGRLLGLSTQSVAAALKLLEDKGLVGRNFAKGTRGFGGIGTRWFLTEAGLNAEVK